MNYDDAKALYESLPTTIPFDDFLNGEENGNWGMTEKEYVTIYKIRQTLKVQNVV